MSIFLIQRIKTDEPTVPNQVTYSFTHAYFAFLRYFQRIPYIERDHVIIGAHFTYGVMPTMLAFKHDRFDDAATILNQVKHEQPITNSDLTFLIGLINNSLVGVSKLLHFIAPHHYAIWDSRVCNYLYPNISYSRMHAPATYRTYLETCNEVIQDPAFASIHESINHKMGQPVTALRAVEVVMYTRGYST